MGPDLVIKGAGLVPLSYFTGTSSLMLLLVSSSSLPTDSSKFVSVEFVSGWSMCWSFGMPADVGGL
jgi:hypothetical protein